MENVTQRDKAASSYYQEVKDLTFMKINVGDLLVETRDKIDKFSILRVTNKYRDGEGLCFEVVDENQLITTIFTEMRTKINFSHNRIVATSKVHIFEYMIAKAKKELFNLEMAFNLFLK